MHGLSRFPDIEIVGEASDGTRAEAAVIALRPDVVTMDVVMPMVSGLDAIRHIMARCPTPIIVVSDAYASRRQLSLDAMKAGAVDVFPKPDGGFDDGAAAALADMLRLAARTRIRGRRPAAGTSTAVVSTGAQPASSRPASSLVSKPPRSMVTRKVAPRPSSAHLRTCGFVGIVSSTGGPQALHQLLQTIDSKDVPPIAVVQHISPGFDKSLATWLNRCTALDVRLARDHLVVGRGTVVVAPNDVHLEIMHGGVTRLVDAPKLHSHRPSGTVLLRSLAFSFGSRAMAIVLTGMGDDGADGAVEIESRGGTVLAQDPETAIIDGMPRTTIARTRSAHVTKIDQMKHFLIRRGARS